MSAEQNRAIIRRYREIHNSGKLDALHVIVAPDIVSHNGLPGLPPGIEGGKAAHQFFSAAFPDTHITTDDLIAEGDQVVERFTARFTHKGEFMGIPPTGKSSAVTGMSIFRIADGKIVEQWGQNDGLGLLQQLGAMPTP